VNGAIHLVATPATAQLPGPPVIISCKAIKIEGTLIIFADASTPDMSETEMLRAVMDKLLPVHQEKAG
jgi:hypothetical protein